MLNVTEFEMKLGIHVGICGKLKVANVATWSETFAVVIQGQFKGPGWFFMLNVQICIVHILDFWHLVDTKN